MPHNRSRQRVIQRRAAARYFATGAAVLLGVATAAPFLCVFFCDYVAPPISSARSLGAAEATAENVSHRPLKTHPSYPLLPALQALLPAATVVCANTHPSFRPPQSSRWPLRRSPEPTLRQPAIPAATPKPGPAAAQSQRFMHALLKPMGRRQAGDQPQRLFSRACPVDSRTGRTKRIVRVTIHCLSSSAAAAVSAVRPEGSKSLTLPLV